MEQMSLLAVAAVAAARWGRVHYSQVHGALTEDSHLQQDAYSSIDEYKKSVWSYTEAGVT